MMRDVTEVVCLGGTRLLLTFDDGARRETDVAALTDSRGVFKPLKDQAYFRRVCVDPDMGSIVWPYGADFCPDVLYEKSTPAQTQETA